MKRIIVLVALVGLVGCSKESKPGITHDLTQGDCVHISDTVFKITAVGKDAYGMMVINRNVTGENFFTYSKVDTHMAGVKVDCTSDLRKQHDEYVKAHQ